ncbi:MAG: hypothetical protein ABJX82_13260 [Paracoccaceae bacterium]
MASRDGLAIATATPFSAVGIHLNDNTNQHFSATLTNESSAAYFVAWGGVVDTAAGTFPAGRMLPPDWFKKHINQKEM